MANSTAKCRRERARVERGGAALRGGLVVNWEQRLAEMEKMKLPKPQTFGDLRKALDAAMAHPGPALVNVKLQPEATRKPQQFGWFMNLVWGNFSVNNLRLAVGPNILRQFKNQIPFGIAISGVGNIDPLNQTDWVSNNGFFILTSDDVAAVETVVYG